VLQAKDEFIQLYLFLMKQPNLIYYRWVS